MTERMIRVGDIELWTEDFGDPTGETILLIQGPGTGLLWPDELCEALADGGRHVIRYDHRDTGRSTTVDFAKDPYTFSDLAADAVGVLDAYVVSAGHLVGFSGGGMVAQTVAIEHPDRVVSLTSWGSTPLGASAAAAFQGQPAGDLPPPERKVIEAFALVFQPAEDDEERIDRGVSMARAFAGTLAPFDEGAARDRQKRALAHTRSPEAVSNHFLAAASAPDRIEALARVTAPTLVIHGTVDPAWPLAHGEATARAIPGARLLTIEGVGHDFPASALAQIVPAILEHTAAPVEARR